MLKSIRARLTVIFIGLLVMIVATMWGINRWALESFYISEKVKSLNEVYHTIDEQLAENAKHGISIAEAMRRGNASGGRVTEGNLLRIMRDYSDMANVSILMIDNSTWDTSVYSSARDAKFLKERMEQYIFGRGEDWMELMEVYDNYRIQKSYDPIRKSMYLESWGFFSDNSTAFIMSIPLSSIGESALLSNRFLTYVGFGAIFLGTIVMYWVTKRITDPIHSLSNLSEKMSNLDFDAHYEPSPHETEETLILGGSMNVLSARLKETIGELKTANASLQKDIEEKTRLDERRQEFITNVSHELKTPIALIQGYAEGLQEGMGDDKETRDYYCDVIVDEANKMNTMVKQLLTLSSLETGHDRPVMARFNLTELIEGVIASAGILLMQNQVTAIFEVTGPVYVWADEFKIEEVVTNYLSNAIHHAGGERKIVIRILEEINQVRVMVFNTGTPIPEEDIPNIWNKFFKVDKAHTRAYGGTGIGLSIVKAIMEAHHQTCGVKNRDNGVEFWFTLDNTN